MKCLSVAQGIFYDKGEGSQILEIRDKLVSMCTLCGREFYKPFSTSVVYVYGDWTILFLTVHRSCNRPLI